MVDPLVVAGITAGIVAALSKGKETVITPEAAAITPALKQIAKDETIQRAAPERVGECEKVLKPGFVPPAKPEELVAAEREYLAIVKKYNDKMNAFMVAAGIPQVPGIPIETLQRITQTPEWKALQAQQNAEVQAVQQRINPIAAAYGKTTQVAYARHEAEFRAVLDSYRAKGWGVYGTGPKFSTTVYYVCPPGKFPIHIQARLDAILKADQCILTYDPMIVRAYGDGDRDFQVIIAELKKRGWVEKRVKPPPAVAQAGAGPWAQIATSFAIDRTYLCPQGKVPPGGTVEPVIK